MKKTVGALVTLLCLAATSALASVSCPVPVSRETILASPHKRNNDGSWGYGWVRTTGRMLIGFEIDPFEGSTVESAVIKLYVAQNHFNVAGRLYVAHPWEPSQGVTQWLEGDNLFNTFSYCTDSSLFVAAQEYPPTGAPDGATWNCSIDTNYLSGGEDCTGASVWAPAEQPDVQAGFKQDIADRIGPDPEDPVENGTFEKLNECDHPVMGTCKPTCGSSRQCYAEGQLEDPPKTVDDCWRTVEIDVTTDVQEALAAVPDYDDPSWLIKRAQESAAGAFHFFSREGAICILGIPDLQPVLVVQVAGSTCPTIPQPPDHCDAY